MFNIFLNKNINNPLKLFYTLKIILFLWKFTFVLIISIIYIFYSVRSVIIQRRLVKSHTGNNHNFVSYISNEERVKRMDSLITERIIPFACELDSKFKKVV